MAKQLTINITVNSQGAVSGSQAAVAGLKNVQNQAALLENAMGGLMAQFAGFASASAILGTVADHFAGITRNAIAATEAIQAQREAQAALGMMRGEGSTTATIASQLASRMKTYQTAAEATAFQGAAFGAGESSIDKGGVPKRIDPGEFARFSDMMGKFQALQGGDAGAYGTLTGMMPQLMGRRIDAREGFAKMMQLYEISKPGNQDFGPFVQQYLKNTGLIGPGMFTMESLAATQSAFSLQNKPGAGEEVQQFLRATVGGLGRMRGAKMMEGISDVEQEKQGKYLAGIKATDQMTPGQIGDLIVQDLQAQEAREKAAGRIFNPFSYLKFKGFGNTEDVQSILDWAKVQEPMRTTIGPASRTPVDPEKAMQDINARAAADPKMWARRTALMGDIGRATVGVGPQEYYTNLMKASLENLKSRGEIPDLEYKDVMGGWDPRNIGYRDQIKLNAEVMLTQEAARVGATTKGLNIATGKDFLLREAMRHAGFGAFGLTSDFAAGLKSPGQKDFYQLGARIGERGGNVIPGAEAMMEAAQIQLQAARLNEERIKAGVPAALPAGADGQPWRNGPPAP